MDSIMNYYKVPAQLQLRSEERTCNTSEAFCYPFLMMTFLLLPRGHPLSMHPKYRSFILPAFQLCITGITQYIFFGF